MLTGFKKEIWDKYCIPGARTTDKELMQLCTPDGSWAKLDRDEDIRWEDLTLHLSFHEVEATVYFLPLEDGAVQANAADWEV